MHQNKEIKWSAYEYHTNKKSSDWYWAVGIIGTAIAVTAFLYDNILFSVFVVIGAFTLMLYASKEPRRVVFEIDGRGIKIGNNLYPYSNLRSFNVLEKEHENKLIVQSEKLMMPYLHIPLEDLSPEEVRNFLIEHLPEDDHQESLAETVMEYLGF